MSKTLGPWPTWYNQLNDPALDGDGGSGNNTENNCGPESISAVVEYLTGVNMDADYIKDAEYGAAYQGYTDFGHMQQFLAGHCGVPSGLLQASPGTLAQHIRAWIDAGHPAIVLFWADTVARTGGHFSCAIGYTTDAQGNIVGITRHNVWGGVVENLTLEQFESYVQVDSSNIGSALSINRQRSIVL